MNELELEGENEDNAKEHLGLNFNITNNAWINSGLITLAQHLNRIIEEDPRFEVDIEFNSDNIFVKGMNDSPYAVISQAIHNIAARGTYNFSTAFKIINNKSGANYTEPKVFPNQKDDIKATIEIFDSEREILKDNKQSDGKKQQIWKMRMSYFGSKDNYLKIGLNLKDQSVFKKLREFKDGKEMCPICGMPSNTLIEMKQFFNPLSSEHHNNVVEGVSTDIRKKVKACPKCIILCYFALFDYHIPFFYIPGKETYLVIPNTPNIETLSIINNNLSLKGQFTDFTDPACTSYATNIQSLPYKSKSAALLALLHNIINKYSRIPSKELPTSPFMEVPQEKFIDMVEWLFISKNSYSITHMRVNEKVYEILTSQKDPGGDKVYLVPDVLCRFSFDVFDENDIERFYNGLLKLDAKEISEGLFKMAKKSISKADKIKMYSAGNESSPLDIFRKVFLSRIMEVSTMLEEGVKKACEEIGEKIGRGFSSDVGMMTKFAYAASTDDFRSAVADALFRLAKKTALNEGESYYFGEESLKTLLKSLESADFEDIRNYFVSFMSIYALSENYKKQKKSREGR